MPEMLLKPSQKRVSVIAEMTSTIPPLEMKRRGMVEEKVLLLMSTPRTSWQLYGYCN